MELFILGWVLNSNSQRFWPRAVSQISSASNIRQNWAIFEFKICLENFSRSIAGILCHLPQKYFLKEMLWRYEADIDSAVAQACVHHEQFVTDFLVSCENEAAKTSQPALPLAACIDACRADPVISTCSSHYYHEQLRPVSGQPCMDDEPIRDAVLGKAINEMRAVAIQYRVDPNDLERATAELINTAGKFP